MDPQVQAALIGGGAALMVALFGIGGTIVGQYVAARKAHANALDLFQKQVEEQANARADDAAEQRATTFLAERKAAYADLASALRWFPDMVREEAEARSKAGDAQRRHASGEDVLDLAELVTASVVATSRLAETRTRVFRASEVVQLLASREIGQAALNWMNAVSRDVGDATLCEVRFMKLAREDVGADPSPQPQSPSGAG